jgi:hypothetical protein
MLFFVGSADEFRSYGVLTHVIRVCKPHEVYDSFCTSFAFELWSLRKNPTNYLDHFLLCSLLHLINTGHHPLIPQLTWKFELSQ